MWQTIDFREPSPRDAKLDRLENSAAVYFFYLNIHLSSDLSSTEWCSQVVSLLSLKQGIDIDIPLGFYEAVKLEHRSGYGMSYLTDSKLDACLSEDSEFLNKISMLMDELQFMLPPLYVGETSLLRDRVSAHLTSGALLERFNEGGIKEEDLLLRFVYLDDIGISLDLEETKPAAAPDDEELLAQTFFQSAKTLTPGKQVGPQLKFVEELLSRLMRPRFIRKLGEHKLSRSNDKDG